MTVEEIKKELKNVFIGTYEYNLFICDSRESIYMNNKQVNNSTAFRDLDIEKEKSKEDFVSYYYNPKSGDWPEAPNDIEGYTGLYKLVRELKFRYILKEKGLKYNFDDCKKGDIFCVEFDNIPVMYFIIKDSRCFIDSTSNWAPLFMNATHIKSITKLKNNFEKIGLKAQFEQAQQQDYEKLTLQDVEDALMSAIYDETWIGTDSYALLKERLKKATIADETHSEKSPKPKIRTRKNKYNFKINKNI